jgi:hypothetical protein
MITLKKADNITMEERLERFNQRMQEAQKRSQIQFLAEQLASTDYQVIKCYEYSLAGLELPYDIQELHNSREAIREQIRELEEQL